LVKVLSNTTDPGALVLERLEDRLGDGVGVDRFIGSPVCLSIRLIVSGKVDTAGGDSTGHWRFPDRAPGGTTVVFEPARQTDVDGENFSCGSRH
jgi:hypothetical protein